MEKTPHSHTAPPDDISEKTVPPESHIDAPTSPQKRSIIPVLAGVCAVVLIGGISAISLIRSRMNTGTTSAVPVENLKSDGKAGAPAALPETTAKGNRVVGTAGDLYPYGKTNDLTYRQFEMDANGGSMMATLSGNIAMYIVYPMGMASGQVLDITPYYSMPTAANAVPLSNELGYGADVQFEGSRHGELPKRMYLIFDLDGGKTVKKIRHDPKVQFFCDPGAGTFDPNVCALINNVPLSQHTNETYAVVSPIRSEGLTNLANLKLTIPIGYENLLVAEITGEGTYIPQKLSRELLADLITANGISSKTTIYRTEGAVQEIKNGIYPGEDIKNAGFSLSGGTENELVKVWYELPVYYRFVKKLQAGAGLTPEEKILAKTLGSMTLSETDGSEKAMKDLKSEIRSLTGDRNHPTNIVSGIGLMLRMEQAKIADFSKEKEELLAFLKDEEDYIIDEPDTNYLSNILIAQSLLYRSAELSARPQSQPFSLIPKVYAVRHGVVDGPQEWFDQTNAIIDKICADPNSTARQIRNTMEVAGRTGEDNRLSRCQKKLCEKLKSNLANAKDQTPIQVGQEWGMYQGSCEDDDNRDEEYAKKLDDRYTVLVCNTLLDKNLITFAWNEVHCEERLSIDHDTARKQGLENARRHLRGQ